MWLERVSGPSQNVIEIEDARDHLRILDQDNDSEIQAAISAATAYLDVDEDGFGGLGFPLVSQQWKLRVPGFAEVMTRLPFARVTSVDAIDVIGADDVPASVPPPDYMLTGSGRLKQVVLTSGASWPNVADRPDAVTIRFTAGWADVDAVPGDIKAAARLLIGHFFENRTAVADGPSAEIALGVERLTTRYKAFAI
ncbi:head-tail connector protein [uncultured Pelagimonas sp.]|uniref:head-tail connector protein n=1 Tax=uncultured Pelagimonas sp. TaxID=1618102 RepID=UPI00345AFD5F